MEDQELLHRGRLSRHVGVLAKSIVAASLLIVAGASGSVAEEPNCRNVGGEIICEGEGRNDGSESGNETPGDHGDPEAPYVLDVWLVRVCHPPASYPPGQHPGPCEDGIDASALCGGDGWMADIFYQWANHPQLSDSEWVHSDRQCVAGSHDDWVEEETVSADEVWHELVTRLLPRPDARSSPDNGRVPVAFDAAFWVDGAFPLDGSEYATFSLAGFDVDVRAEAVRTVWDFGDGSAPEEFFSAGRPYPEPGFDDVTHRYDDAGAVVVSVAVEWSAAYRVGEGEWVDIGTAMVSDGEPAQVMILELPSVVTG